MSHRKHLDSALAQLSDKCGDLRGRRFWRTLDELADTPEFQELMRQEFPDQADIWPSAVSRRKFLSLMAASLALAGISSSGCSVRPAPSIEILPYVHPPEEVIPGRPLFFATAMVHAGSALGLLVESHEGRPTKIEGNPDHPASLGATDAFHQAAVLTLYDPDRAQTVTHLGQTRTWDQAASALRAALAQQRDSRGAGLRIVSERVVSPTLGAQMAALLEEFPAARWIVWEPVHDDQARRASRWAFGREVLARYDFTQADVVLSLDADFLSGGSASVRYAADFMSRRRVRTPAVDGDRPTMNRLYVVETNVSCTGAKADHRLALRPSQMEQFVRALAGQLQLPQMTAGTAASADGNSGEAGQINRWAAAIARDLTAHRGRSVVIVGDGQSASVHLLAHAINDRLENVGKTVFYSEPIAASESGDESEAGAVQALGTLVRDMSAGRVELLLILGSNPVYTAPADLGFVQAMQQVPLRAQLSLYEDETSLECHWHLPESHFLESWGDALAFDGTASIIQPLIAPLSQGRRSQSELIALLAEGREVPGQQIVRDHWRRRWERQQQAGEFEVFWQTAVHDGVVPDTRLEPLDVRLQDGWQEHLTNASYGEREPSTRTSSGEPALELKFEPDPTIYDGRYANNAWLQELPKPITKLTWDNAALISPATAKRLHIPAPRYAHGGEHGGYHVPVVELTLDGRAVRAPVWIVPGHADGCVTVTLGYGRTHAGRVGGSRAETVGFDAYRLRTANNPWSAAGLQVELTGEDFLLAGTQQHYLIEDRHLVRAATLTEFEHNPRFATEPDREQERDMHRRASGELTLYEPSRSEGNRWGMAIDMTACIGCSACVVACQAENNIPVVGKDQVAFGREMHWLRIDRYVEGPAEEPDAFYFQPLPCMHCEQAPCEYVCPVAATVHSADGLNDMIYNRCVGTRFCSNNCPYKVRRFNFLHYSDWDTPERRLQYNPDVTVRSRGVMEKCTYCVQRIRTAQIAADTEHRKLEDGEVLTACQAVCPTRAIVFGDLNDEKSAVKQMKDSPLEYGLLSDLNTHPRTTYLAALRNPNPELET